MFEVARCCSTQECFQGLREACGNAALPSSTVARWAKAFWEGKDAVQDNLRTEQPHVQNNIVQLLASLLDAVHHWTVCELAASLQRIGYPINFQGAIIALLCSRTGLVGPVPK